MDAGACRDDDFRIVTLWDFLVDGEFFGRHDFDEEDLVGIGGIGGAGDIGAGVLEALDGESGGSGSPTPARPVPCIGETVSGWHGELGALAAFALDLPIGGRPGVPGVPEFCLRGALP